MGSLQVLSEAKFGEFISSSELVLVDFYATWCPPCQAFLPILDKASTEYLDRIKMAKLNIDEARQLASQFEIRSVPTVVLFRNGKPVSRKSGLLQAGPLRAWLDQTLAQKPLEADQSNVSTTPTRGFSVRYLG